jgi:hypothetical protein
MILLTPLLERPTWVAIFEGAIPELNNAIAEFLLSAIIGKCLG